MQLHATVMNARHRKRCSLLSCYSQLLCCEKFCFPSTRQIVFRTSRRNIQDYFDARHIFRVYGSEDWGEYHIPQVHLSQRFKHDEDGYYHCCTSIPLPEKNAAKRLRYINKTRHGFHVLRLQVNAKTSLIVLLVTHQVADGTPDISASSFHVLRFPS